MYKGSFVALVTPFKNDTVDYAALERLVDLQVRSGTAGLVPCGTTGESPTLSTEEHKEVIAFVVKAARGRIPVIAGTGSNSTSEAIDLTRAAAEAGAQGTLQVSPYYNKPEPDGMFLHFKAIADATGLPMVLYNIPGRTGREIALETVLKLADKVKQVVAIKEASGSFDRVSELCARTKLDVLSGDDSLTVPIIAAGGTGVISVAANFMPRQMAELVSAALGGDLVAATRLHLRYFSVLRAGSYETNPIPVKTAMGLLGLCSDEMRLPLSPMRPENKARLKAALAAAGMLNGEAVTKKAVTTDEHG